jgi:hypothetical protein
MDVHLSVDLATVANEYPPSGRFRTNAEISSYPRIDDGGYTVGGIHFLTDISH